ncbi:MAG: threonine--tRNA ligase [Nitrospinota bacterium]
MSVASHPRFPEQALALRVNGRVVDLRDPLPPDARYEVLTFEDESGREVFRHSSAHLMAQAVRDLFPGAKLTIGPPLTDGFFYDIDYERPFTPEDLERIEARMREIVEVDLPVRRQVLSREEAIELFRSRGEDYKVELVREMPEGEEITAYWQGDFVDLCRGPHVPSTGRLKAFKLLSVAGAYWKGDERNPQLQRIYGTSFPTEEQLRAHLERLEEAKRRDHRVLGRQLGIYIVDERAGSGFIYWQPKGTIIRKTIERFWEDEHQRRGYQFVSVPHLVRDQLFRTSGHYDFYREHMYVLDVDHDEYVVKPMNCPGHILIYKERLHSYRELPIRYAELGTVYRYERSGVLHGMLRVRGFTQDDAHIFCTPEQVQDEVVGVIDLACFMLETFGYREFQVDLSLHDPAQMERYAGEESDWAAAESALERALQIRGLPYRRVVGESAFYGPKIDIKMVDALGRGWQGPTIQFDFNMPRRFGVSFAGPDGRPHEAVMVHRTVLGSMERFVGGLIEHYAGAFPTWLAPVQARVMTITDAQVPFARGVEERLRGAGLRVEGDYRNEKVGYKVREAQLERVPYMLVVGRREAEGGRVALRVRGAGDLGPQSIEAVVERIRRDVESRALAPSPAGEPAEAAQQRR